MRNSVCIFLAVLGLLLAGCGGRGGGNSSATATMPASAAGAGNGATTGASSPTPTAPVAVTPNADATAVPVLSDAPNTAQIKVSSTPFGHANAPMVSVRICEPGSTTNCATIDNVLVDTGSYGLRLFSSVIPAATLAALPPQITGSNQIAQCAEFDSGFTWGTIRSADVAISGELARSVPIQVIGESSVSVPSTAPSACRINTQIASPNALGTNGILGIGVLTTDCPDCANFAVDQAYYACTSGNCVPTVELLSQQVANPVAMFQADNNGVIVELPQVADTGASSSVGTLVFGIDTQANNALSGTGATVIATDQAGDFNATYKGSALTGHSFFDSGSNGFFFGEATIPNSTIPSSLAFLPQGILSLSVAVTGLNAASVTVPFSIANGTSLFNSGNFAFNNLGFSQPGTFDFGLPFFYGRHVYYGIGGTSSPSGKGPYVAYVSS